MTQPEMPARYPDPPHRAPGLVCSLKAGAALAALVLGPILAQPGLAQPAPAPVQAEQQASPPAAGRSGYAALIELEARRRGIPAELAQAVATVESGWNPSAIGTSGEIGLMQIMPATASMLGFRGTLAQLADPGTNIELGVRYLSGAWARAGGDLCVTLMKYRAGHAETMMSLRSLDYCQRAQRYLASVGSPLANSTGTNGPGLYLIPAALGHAPAWQGGARRMPDLLTQDEWVRLKTGHRTAVDSERFWAARTAQLQAMRAQRATVMASRMVLTRHAHLSAPLRRSIAVRVASVRRWRAIRTARLVARPVAMTPAAGSLSD